MKKIISLLILPLIIITAGFSQLEHIDPGSCDLEKICFDRGWKFHLGDAASVKGDFGYGTGMLFGKSGESVGAIDPDFNDSTWRTVDLLHDWVVELDFLNVTDKNLQDHGFKPVGRLYPQTSIGWYRKSFTVPESDREKRLSIKFDGVFRDSKVWLNGHYLGTHMSGYSEFTYDITDYVKYGRKNVIVVRADATPYGWPCINSHFGIMDVCGFPKNNYYYYQAWWSDKDVLHIFPHWNWKGNEGDTINVWCNTNCETVELFMNGRSLGKKNVQPNSHLEWNVVYQPGILEAKGNRHGKILTDRVETTGNPSMLRLFQDRINIRADGQDISVINVIVADENGLEVPDASNLIQFHINGKGKIIGVGNGDPSSHEADKMAEGTWKRHLFNGKCQVIVQSDTQQGQIVLDVSSEGIRPNSVTINAGSSGQK